GNGGQQLGGRQRRHGAAGRGAGHRDGAAQADHDHAAGRLLSHDRQRSAAGRRTGRGVGGARDNGVDGVDAGGSTRGPRGTAPREYTVDEGVRMARRAGGRTGGGGTAEISLLRIVAQRLAGPAFDTPAGVVRWLTAMQAQDFPGALTSVALRTAPRDRAAVVAALDAGEIVRS